MAFKQIVRKRRSELELCRGAMRALGTCRRRTVAVQHGVLVLAQRLV